MKEPAVVRSQLSKFLHLFSESEIEKSKIVDTAGIIFQVFVLESSINLTFWKLKQPFEILDQNTGKHESDFVNWTQVDNLVKYLLYSSE